MFKVGDFVRTSIYGIQKVIGFDGERYIVTGSISHIREIDCDLWQPREDEWCIFSNEPSANKNKFTVARFHRVAHGQCREGQYRDLSGNYWKHCEPFIGEIPSFLKENK
jgi:hypothetical protein